VARAPVLVERVDITLRTMPPAGGLCIGTGSSQVNGD
jgi:hypothetical protein